MILDVLMVKTSANNKLLNSYSSLRRLLRGTYLQSSDRFTDLESELMVASGERPGEGIVREFGVDMYSLLYLKWIINKNQLYSTGTSAQCHMEAWTRGKSGEEWIRVYVWLSPFSLLSETITILLIGYLLLFSSCPTLCDPPGSSVHGILQARILEWVAISLRGDLPRPEI